VLGRQLVLNPVAVLVSLVFFGWMWGLAGTLLAVPLLACFKIMCEHIDWLRPAGEFLA
jgi:predicted PurR-regulated permease PerM